MEYIKEIISQLQNKGYDNLGFVWNKLPDKVIKCRESKHPVAHVSNRTGSTNVCYCEACNYYYTFDSSD